MAIKYFSAEDVKEKAHEIVKVLNWKHIDLENVGFLRSTGSTSRGTIARCHALGKAMQLAMKRVQGFYLIEVIHERYDKLSEEDKIDTIIHELMHIPKSFGGGFIHHDIVNDKNVKIVMEHFINLKNKNLISPEPFDIKKHLKQKKKIKLEGERRWF